jgi:hypothetical protein
VSVLDHDYVRAQLRAAWHGSQPGTSDAHEEGGFVLRNGDGSLIVEWWPRGSQNQILVPHYAAGQRNGLNIAATFHTHPNPGPDYQQEPSLTDIRAVRDDPELHGPEYEGEYVISSAIVFRVLANGEVEEVGKTIELLK